LRSLDLSFDDRHQIWTDFIQNMNINAANKDTLLGEVDRWAAAKLNGRQIRNVILMAENLAASDEDPSQLTPDHIDKLLHSTLEFFNFNKGNTARTKKIQQTGLSY
jgi:hypothetical protein